MENLFAYIKIYINLKQKNLYFTPKFLGRIEKQERWFTILNKILFWIIFTKQIITIHSCKIYIHKYF